MTSPAALWNAGRGVCSCCAKPVSEWGTFTTKGGMPTVEHVFPRSPAPGALRRIGWFRRWRRFWNTKAVAHSKCNNRKSNRAPTGCEVVFLIAVNCRLGFDEPRNARQSAGFVRIKRRRNRIAKRQRERESLAIGEMLTW